MAPPRVLGRPVDDQTRCVHYAGPLDVVAIRFACCGEYYPCHACHAETAGHPAQQWPRDARDTEAVLCGACGTELTIATYLVASSCPACGAGFNPGCAAHAPLYFEDRAGLRPPPRGVGSREDRIKRTGWLTLCS